MFRLAAIIITIVLFVVLFVGTIGSPAAVAASPSVQVGVFFTQPQSQEDQIPTLNQLHELEASIGRQTDVFLWYEEIAEDFYADAFRPMAQEGRMIQLAWEPHDFLLDPNNQPEYRLVNITNGHFDNDIRRWARQLRDFGYPIYFRPMCEMNGDWVSWGGNANGNHPQDYIPAWRHVHDIFVQEGATNVKWVWSPNRDGSIAEAQATFNTYYPGDNYVDYIGMDGYNWGTLYDTPDWTSWWQSFEEVFGPSYDVAVANTNKQVVIAETATTEVGGTPQNGGKAQWITDAFNSLSTRFPRVAMMTWFNVDKETDWRINSSTASLEAFRAAMQGSDTTPPTVSIATPTLNATVDGSVPVSVSATDDEAVDRVELYVGDQLLGTDTTAPYDFSFNSAAYTDGSYDLSARAYDAAGNVGTASTPVVIDNGADKNYFFGWYDSASPGMKTWVILGNPGDSVQHADVYVGGVLRGSYNIAPQQRATPLYAGLASGPVKVVSTTGGDLLVSERVTYNGTFAELPAVPEADLSSEQYLSWYDAASAGMKNWIVIANGGSQTAQVDVYIAGQLKGHYAVGAGGVILPEYPGTMNGPVRVVSTNGQPLNVSSRVIYNGAFNEVGSKSAAQLTSEYHFTWYDEQSEGMRTWIVVGNQGSEATQVSVYVAEQLVGIYDVPAGGRITPDYPGLMNGPVRVVSTGGQPLIVGQRSLYRGSFEEVPGTVTTDLVNRQWFTWYDNVSTGMRTWILVGNQSSATAEVDVKIGGAVVGHYSIPAGGRVTPTFPGQMNGPVQVVSSDSQAQLVVSQRTTFNNSFDELPGMLIR